MGNKFWNWFLYILLSFIWGSSFILMKEGLLILTAVQVASVRIGDELKNWSARINANPNVKFPQLSNNLEESLRTPPLPAQTPRPANGAGMVIGDTDDVSGGISTSP